MLFCRISQHTSTEVARRWWCQEIHAVYSGGSTEAETDYSACVSQCRGVEEEAFCKRVLSKVRRKELRNYQQPAICMENPDMLLESVAWQV